jgi:hypothetical protein
MRVRILPVVVLVVSAAGCSTGPQPNPFTFDDMKKLLVAQRGAAWVRTNPNSIRDARIGGFHKDWVGNSIICVAMDRENADGQYTGLRPYVVTIAADRTIVGASDPTVIDHCDLDSTQPFPELNVAPAKNEHQQGASHEFCDRRAQDDGSLAFAG